MSRIRAFIGAAALALASLVGVAPAFADVAAKIATIRHLQAGTLDAGEAELAAMLATDPANPDARLGLGLVQAVKVEAHLEQALYRYGLQPDFNTGIPILRLPVAPNPDPEPITYEAFRGILQGAVDELTELDATLAPLDSLSAKITFDLATIVYDSDGDGAVGEFETLRDAIANFFPGTPLPSSGFVVGIDTADAIWLRGYAHIVMAFCEFLLAHDWHEGFDAAFQMYFPLSDLPMVGAPVVPKDENSGFFGSDESDIADAISFVHLISWPVAEPARLLAVRDHLKAAVSLSRQNWASSLGEFDDDHEWLPAPDQHSALVRLSITSTQVKSWLAVLDELDALLDGEKLIPHWRFTEGVNLRRVFEEPSTFDLVLWLTGPAALPYLEAGPLSDGVTWQTLTRAFGTGFGAYAVWFN
ncbi:MAG: hypothetical protein WEB63_12320 [Cucumibacter sp.]